MSSEQRDGIDDLDQIQREEYDLAPANIYITTGFLLSPCWQGEAGKTFGVPLVYCTGVEYLSTKDLATRFALDYGKLRKRLERWRMKHPECAVLVEDLRSGKPRYLFRLKDVAPIITKLKDGRNVQRQPARKKFPS